MSKVSTRGTETRADPLTGALAAVLAVPLRELYAVLVRAGVLVVED